MKILFGSFLTIFVATLLFAITTGRIKSESCCAPSDPKRDKRMNPQE